VPIRRIFYIAAASIAVGALATPAAGAVPHVVQPGETLWSIAAANNFTTRTIAAYNGLSEDSPVTLGETIEIPTEAEGGAALASAGASSASTSAGSTSGSSHTVTAGESLSSIAAANGISPQTLAADNGLSSDASLLAGQTIQVPGASASPTSSVSSTGTSGTPAPTPAPIAPPPASNPYWTAPIPCPSCPSGSAYLATNAASAWNAMRQESLRAYGIDLYPTGPLSAYRSYAQQLYLYDLYLSGRGSLAATPGTSSHEYGTAVDLADPSMRTVIDQIGARYGWVKDEVPSEWWHVNYVGP
jgi:LysM repeat protein